MTQQLHFRVFTLNNYKQDLKWYLGGGNGTPLQYSCPENSMDGGAWWAAVHGVANSWLWLSDFTLTFHFDALEKEMATHSSVLAWSIPGTGEPGGLPSMRSHRVGHDWSNLPAAAAKRYLQTHVHCSIIHNNQKVEGTLMSTDREMNKEKDYSMTKHENGIEGHYTKYLIGTFQK